MPVLLHVIIVQALACKNPMYNTWQSVSNTMRSVQRYADLQQNLWHEVARLPRKFANYARKYVRPAQKNVVSIKWIIASTARKPVKNVQKCVELWRLKYIN